MKKVLNFVKGKKEERRDRIINNSNISVEITNPFGQSVASEDEHVVGLLSGYGYNVDLSGRDKSITKLHKAAWQGNLEKVKLNLKKFDINVVDEYNRTPLHLTASQGHTNIVRFLLNNRAILDISDNDGMSPFLKAVECGVKECVSLLMERGANISTIDNHGNTAVHITAKQGFFNIMSLLLKRRANFDCSNNEGKMPLHVATEQEHREIVQLLLQTGAHVNAVDRINRTPLMLAARGGQTSIASLLLQHGAILDACDNNGWTAEDYAMIGGHEQLALDLKVPHCAPCLPATDMDDLEFSSTDELNDIPNAVLLPEEETQESPRSCVTPPPLNPPRSWEIIQAGMIDQTQVGRRSLMALGTLVSHKESFVENENGFDKQENLLLSSPNHISVRVVAEIEQEDFKGDISDSEWGSDDSLPLDRSLPPPPDSSLESYLLIPELVITPTDRHSKVNLARTPSLDLTDSDQAMDSYKITADEISGRVERKVVTEESWKSNNAIKLQNKNLIHEDNPISVERNAPLNSTQVFIQEDINDITIITETNNLDENEKKNKGGFVNLHNKDGMVVEQHANQKYERLENERYCVVDHFSNFDSSAKRVDLSQSVDSLEEESLIGTVVKRNAFYESHSLELLDEAKKLPHHSRNKSMSACSSQNWSKSVDMLSKPCKAESLPRDSKRIDAQLKCYDEALRELAEEQRVKEDILLKSLKSNSLPFTNFKRSISHNANDTNQKPHVKLRQIIIPKYNTNFIKDKSTPSSLKRTYKQQQNATDILCFNDSHQCKSSTCLSDVASLLSENTPGVTKFEDQQLKSDQSIQSFCKKPPNHPIDSRSLDKHKAYKKRSSSVGSKNKRKSFESSLKLYNSLEFPPPYKKEDVFKSKTSSTWDRYTRISRHSKKPKEQFIQSQANQNHSKADCGINLKNYELLPYPERSQKKEKYDLSVRKKKEENEVSRNGVGRSVSMYTQQSKNKDLSQNQLIESKDLALDEKSDTDSEWSEQQLQNKRKQFLAMHGAVADSEESNDEDPPFWLSKEGCFTRQSTVIENENKCNSREMKKDADEERSGCGGLEDVSSSSDTGSMSMSHSETSVSHPHSLKGHQVLIKDHLKQATEEKGRLEETAAKLLEQTERLQYDLADANQNIIARDDKIIILQDELIRLNMKYSASLDEMSSLKQRLTSTEIELQHIQELLETNK